MLRLDQVSNNLCRPCLLILLFHLAIIEELVNFLQYDFVPTAVHWSSLALFPSTFLHDGVEVLEIGVAVLVVLNAAKHT